MIRLSRLTDYAVVLLSHMEGRRGEGIFSATDLAEKSGLPMPTVAKVLKLLSKGKMVCAQRGAAGGYKLARPSTDISIAAIIEAMDGPIAITDCMKSSAHQFCCINHVCRMKNGWNKVNAALRTAFEAVSLADMTSPSAALPVYEPSASCSESRE